MSKINNEKNDGLSERIINNGLSYDGSRVLIIIILILAIVPFLSISEINKGNLPLPIIAFTIWAIVFYKLSSSLHNKELVSYWVSVPSATLVIIASLFY